MLIIIVYTLDGQSCFDTVNIRQQGTDTFSSGNQVIIPRSNFSCDGRITGYQISLSPGAVTDLVISLPPIIQVWHPTSLTAYTRVDTECPLDARE